MLELGLYDYLANRDRVRGTAQLFESALGSVLVEFDAEMVVLGVLIVLQVVLERKGAGTEGVEFGFFLAAVELGGPLMGEGPFNFDLEVIFAATALCYYSPFLLIYKMQIYEMINLQNVQFTKCQIYETSSLQNFKFT